jgi:GntR family transcriptional regulator/MocR family aminotransferase
VDLHISLGDRRDLTGQVYRQIRDAILDGRLRRGESLPSSRELAARLAVSRNTVVLAYDRLTAEGFLAGRAGVGTYVDEDARAAAPDAPERPAVPLPIRAVWHGQSDPADLSADRPEYDFRSGMPDARYFPFDTWRALVNRQLRPSVAGAAIYADPAGHLGLRTAIARHIGVSRAVRTTPDRILVTSGTQQALDLACRVLVEPGDVVAMEDPGYTPARRLFQSAGARVVGVPVDADGLVVDALPPSARLVYVSPSHQFPLSTRMSLPRRVGLLAWAHRTGAVVVEDDYDCEYRYAGRPIEPLQTLDRGGRVVYVGSFSKTMLPTLRLGFCVAPKPLFAALRKAKYVLDWHSALPMQGALAEFIDRGLFARHVQRMRRRYERRRDAIAIGVDRDLGARLALLPSAAGLHLTARLRSGDTEESTPPEAGLILGYGLIRHVDVPEGLRRLRACFDD